MAARGCGGAVTARSRLTFTAACLFVFLLLEVAPAADVLLPLGLFAIAALLVVDFPHTWRTIRRR